VDVVVSSDGESVAVLDGSGTVHLLDLDTWDLVPVTPCAGVGGISTAPGQDSRFWAGCKDGTLNWFSLTDSGVNVGDASVELAETAITGLAANETFVFALAENPMGDGNPQVHAYNPEADLVMADGFPSTLSYSTVEDMEANANFVFLSHGGASFSKVASGAGGATRQQGAPSAAKTSDIETVGATRVFVAGGSSGLVEYQTGSNILSLSLTDAAGVTSASAIAANMDDEWFAIADDEAGKVLFYDLDTSAGGPTSSQLSQLDFPDEDAPIREFGIIGGYLIGGTDNGALHFMTDRPWVEANPATPAAALNGETVSITFSSDQSGTWTARRGATFNGGGTRVASGTVIADEPTEATIEIDGDFKEGDNVLRIVVENEDGKNGHDSTTVNVDNPPSRVPLNSGDIGFGDTRIILDLNGIDDEDLSHYAVYVSSEKFEREDYPAEGPAFIGVESDKDGSALKLPRRVNLSPGKDKTISIEPLTNGVTYYLAVRAYDAAGQESPMSNVVSETPRETFGAAELAGEKGGHACSGSAASATGLLALIGGLFAGGRRSSWMVALCAGGMMSTPSFADTESEWPQKGKDIEDFIGRTFEARYGGMTLEDPSLNQIFGETGHNIFWVEYGMTLFELAEITASTGLYKDSGVRVDAQGNKSAEKDTMTVFPFAVDATFRLDVLPEQPIVPFAGIGYDYWLWEETWTGGGEMSGGKSGSHTTLGVNLLLDIFQPSRASRLRASSGITDSYITIEWRNQVIGDDSGLSFSGDAVLFGLKLDH